MIASAPSAQMEGLRRRIHACRTCPSMPPERRRIAGQGVLGALAMFIGEAPGRLGADRTGVPFSGDRSGKLLRDLMAELGLSTETNAYITNVVRCNPRDERGNNRKPRADEVERCAPFLLQEIAVVDPRIVVPLGDLACRVILAQPISRGVLRPTEWQGRIVFALYHPGYATGYSYPVERYRQEFHQLRPLLEAARRWITESCCSVPNAAAMGQWGPPP